MTRPSAEELKKMRCKECGGMPAYSAQWATTEWKPGKFCSCPFSEGGT